MILKKQLILLLFSIFFISNVIAQVSNPQKNINKMVLEYSDGNGNYYKITKDSISYEPIKREMSSSGIYDGGEGKSNKITEAEFTLIFKEFETIFNNKSIHIPNRMKISGRLRLNNGDDTKAVIIKKSEEQNQLELLLKELLKM